MKRGLLVAALVLVPFAALVALGFHFSRDEAPVVPREPEPLPPRPVVVSAPTPMDAGAPIATLAPETPPPLLAPFTPSLRRCFTDNGLHGHIHLRFTPRRDGTFGGVSVDENSTQSPYVAACVEDVLEGARFEPSPGPDYAPVDFTFSF